MKGKTKAGKKRKLTLKVTATSGTAVKAKIRFKSSSRKAKVQKTATILLKPGATVKKTIVVSSTQKVKGKVAITASSGNVKAKATLRYKAKTGTSGSASGR